MKVICQKLFLLEHDGGAHTHHTTHKTQHTQYRMLQNGIIRNKLRLCSFLKVPMPLFLVQLSHPEKEVIFNLTIYPIKTTGRGVSTVQNVSGRGSVFIKRVSMAEELDRG